MKSTAGTVVTIALLVVVAIWIAVMLVACGTGAGPGA